MQKLSLALAAALCLAGCSATEKPVFKKKAASQLPGKSDPEVEVEELEVGSGPKPHDGQVAVVHYTGRFKSGKVFDSSVERDKPIEFEIGKGTVVKGWELAVTEMKVGGKYRVTIPPKFGYRDKPHADIPANSTLIFDMELLAVKDKGPEKQQDGNRHARGGRGGCGR